MQVIWAPILGVMSDRFGRRPIILFSNFGLGFDYLLMAFAPTVGWLFLGRTISGMTGASFATAGAYIADVTPPEKRAGGYGSIGAAWGLGFASALYDVPRDRCLMRPARAGCRSC